MLKQSEQEASNHKHGSSNDFGDNNQWNKRDLSTCDHYMCLMN